MPFTATPAIRTFFDDTTNTVSYVVVDTQSKHAVIIDPVLDFDHRSGETSTKSADEMLRMTENDGLCVDWILETHAHADHLSAAPYIKEKTGAKVGIGEHIRDVQKIFGPIFNAKDVAADGSAFDQLFGDGDVLTVGSMDIAIIATPGHTPACVSYQIGDAVFIGDTMFMPDYGTARADFPGGDAAVLYRSIRKLLALPSETRLFMCHDYKAPGRDYFAWETTVGEQRQHNVHIRDGVGERDFVAMRQSRDATLAEPLLLLPAIQVNIRAGELPPAEDNGISYLKIPVKLAR